MLVHLNIATENCTKELHALPAVAMIMQMSQCRLVHALQCVLLEAHGKSILEYTGSG